MTGFPVIASPRVGASQPEDRLREAISLQPKYQPVESASVKSAR